MKRWPKRIKVWEWPDEPRGWCPAWVGMGVGRCEAEYQLVLVRKPKKRKAKR